jgi:hypothetical protein
MLSQSILTNIKINLNMEIWKNIENENYYQVSNLGNVRSLNYKNTGLTKILKQSNHEDGYKIISIYINKIRKTVRIHRLVANAFIENSCNKSEVNHINGIKDDNRVENLEWCTHSENIKHSYKIGLQKGLKRTNNPNSKITEKQINEIINSNLTQKELGKIYNISQTQVSYVIRREKKLSYGV